jgi:hypothetical protein
LNGYLAAASNDEADQFIADAIVLTSRPCEISASEQTINAATIPNLVENMVRMFPTRYDCSFWGTLDSLICPKIQLTGI